MCLYLDPNYNRKVAEEDIEVFKVVKSVERDGIPTYYSPFMNMIYEVGGEYSSELVVETVTVKPSCSSARNILDYIVFIEDVSAYVNLVDEALHSFASLEDATRFCDEENEYLTAHVMRCVIPKGASYVEGDWPYFSSLLTEKPTVVKSFGSTNLIVKEIL